MISSTRALTSRPRSVNQPSASTQPATTQAVHHRLDLGGRQVVQPTEAGSRHGDVQGEQHVGLESADALHHQGGDVAVTAVLTEQ